VTDTLAVDVNRNGLHTAEVDERFEADGPFVVELTNHGEATHVHLHLDDDLSGVAGLEAANHYVESGETRGVRVEVLNPREWPADTIRGKLKVVAAHGREKRFVDVVFDRTTDDEPVEVDPELAATGSNPTAGGATTSDASSTLRLIPVVVLGLVAVLLAVGALLSADGIDFVFGAFAVVAAALCAVAAYYLS
jgi:hypothetical protein